MKDPGRNAWPVTIRTNGYVFLLIALSFFAYFHSISNGFLIDDHIFLEHRYQNVFKTPLDFFIKIPPGTHHYAPLYYLTNTFLFHHLHARPDLFRTLIWLIFLANVLLFFKLTSIITHDQRKAFICCALFTIHPIHAFYVHMLSANFVFFYTLCLQASLLCVWAYLTSAAKRPGCYVASLLFFLTGLLFFEAATLYPLYLLVFLIFVKKDTWLSRIKFTLPFFVLSFINFIVWIQLCQHESSFIQKIRFLDLSFPDYLATVTRLIVWYISRLIYPKGIVFIYNMPAIHNGVWMWLGLSGIALSLHFLFTQSCHKNSKALSCLWFLIGCLFVFPASLTHAYMGLVIESHWLYFASIGLFLLFTLGLCRVLDRLRPLSRYASLGLLALYFIFWTQNYRVIARSEKSYCEYWVQICPGNLIPLITLSKIYADEGRLDEAFQYAQKALRLSRDCVPRAYENLAAFLTLRKDYAQAEDVIQRALQKGFYSANLINNLGAVQLHKGDIKTAEQTFMTAIRNNPDDILPRLNLARLYRSAGQENKAIKLYEGSLALTSDKNRVFDINSRLMVLYLKHNNLERYRLTVDNLLTQNPQLKTYLQLSRILERYQYGQEAHSLLNQARDHYPGDQQLELYYRAFMKRLNAAQ